MTTGGAVAVDTRSYFDDAQFPGQLGRWQPGATLEWEYRTEQLGATSLSLALEVSARWDARDDARRYVEPRVAYIGFETGQWDWRVGLDRLFWGGAESRHLVNVINQINAIEDIDEEDFLGQPMISARRDVEWGDELATIELFVLPYFRERPFPSADGRVRAALPVRESAAQYRNGAGRSELDWAIRASTAVGAFDIGAHVFVGTGREPALLPMPDGRTLRPVYQQTRQFGLDLQYTAEAWLWKFEGLVRSGHGDRFGALVAGVEYTLFGAVGAADLGLLAEYLYDGRDESDPLVPPTTQDDDIFVGARLGFNDTADTQLLAGVIRDRDDRSTVGIVEASRRFAGSIVVTAEGRWFDADAKDLVLAQLDQDSFVALSVAYHF